MCILYALRVTRRPISHLSSALRNYKCFEMVELFETRNVLWKDFGDSTALSITVQSFLETFGSCGGPLDAPFGSLGIPLESLGVFGGT